MRLVIEMRCWSISPSLRRKFSHHVETHDTNTDIPKPTGATGQYSDSFHASQ